jgi:hypothetical protein
MTVENLAKTEASADANLPEEQDSERYFWILPSLSSTIFHMVLVLALVLITNEVAVKQEASYVSMSADSVEPVSLEQEEELPKLPEQPMSDFNSVEIADTEPAMASVEVEQATVLDDAPPAANEMFASGDLRADILSEIVSGTSEGDGGVSTIFGRVGAGKASGGKRGGGGGSGGAGLVGRFYDLKQDRNRKKLPYGGGFPEYIATINRLASQGFSESVMQQYYQASILMSYSQLLIPADTRAEDAPKAFAVDKEVEPRGWFVHYSGTVIPPQSGEYRFVGFFDDMLIVYVNGQPVLDGSWVPMCNVGKGPYDDSLRQEFRGPGVSGSRTAYMGKWFKISGPTKIDIVIGETPGGLVGGLLMFQQNGTQYAKRPDGTPILPLFSVGLIDAERIRKDPFAQRYGLLDPAPIWKSIESKELRLR